MMTHIDTISLPQVWELEPIAFYCYPSVTEQRILEIDRYDFRIEIVNFRNDLVVWFNEKGILDPYGGKVRFDNKIVFQCQFKKINLFFGFKDSKFTIGLNARQMN